MRAYFSIPLVAAALVHAPAIYAANPASPTVPECLSATETSLKLRAAKKVRAARAQVLICSQASCPAEVRDECIHRIAELNADIPTVVFAVRSGTGDELTAVKVSMDGEPVADHLDGTAIPLDPGSHVFTFEVANQATTTKTLVLHEGEKNRREPIVLGGAAGAATGAAAEPAAETGSTGHGQRLAGIVVGGAGVAGLILGGIFGGLTFSSWASAKDACPTLGGCSAQANSDRSSAVTDGAVSTAMFVAGGVLVAAGAIVYFTAPKDKTSTVGLDLSPGRLGLSGTF